MAIREIRTKGDPVLGKVCRKVEKFDERLKILVEDMIDTMYEADGVGLAAPQIGILRQVVVIDAYDDQGARIFINPTIVEQDGEQFGQEGCLSIPGVVGNVMRPNHVVVEAQDVEGKAFKLEAEEFLARVLCHEIDHINGLLFDDKAVDLEEA